MSDRREGPRTTKQYDFEVENRQLLEDLRVIDGEVHTTENADDIIPLIEDDEIRREEETGYAIEMSVNAAYGQIGWNFYNHNSGGEHGGRPLLTQPLKSIDDIREQQDDIMADTVMVNSLPALLTPMIKNADKQVAYLRAANRFQVEEIGADGEDYFVPVTVNPDRPRESIRQIEEHAHKDQVAYIMANAVHDYPLGNHRYEELLAAIEDTGLPLVTHGSAFHDTHDYLRMDSYFEQRALGQVIDHIRDMVSLIGEEVPERFDIDFCFAEHALSSVPFLVGQLDREFQIRGYDADGLDGPPSDYLAEFFFGSQPLPSYPDTGYLGDSLERLGIEDQVVYMSDYPHPDGDHPGDIADHPGLSDHQKRRILQHNAEDLFGV